ncbi:MAG: lipopolysaccharide kinase InaA family protein, partial [Deltaproteobacteria bacterium]
RHVRRRDSGPVACRGLATLDVAWLEAVRDDPERLFREERVRWHKQTAKHRVGEVRLPAAAGAPCAAGFLKCVEQRPSLWRRCLASFRFSPVRRSWEVGHALLRRGIDTPRPLLFVERGDWASRRCYLLTEAVPDSIGLPEFFDVHWPAMNAGRQRDWLTRHLGRLALQMRRLHESGFDHRDLKFANLLVSRDPADPRIWFLDLEGVRVWGRLPARRAAQNLARINVSAMLVNLPGNTDRLRFLKWYLADAFQGEWKWWWRRIARLSQEKISGNQRRGRAVS